MTMKKHYSFSIFLTLFFLLVTASVKAQGCSDAGFCTVDSFQPHSHDENDRPVNELRVGLNTGAADYGIMVFGTNLEYHRRFSDEFSLETKLTSLGQSGNDISTYGLSDVYITGTYRFSERASFTLGTKIPLSDANKKQDGLALPMDYQSSLGTFDLIAGFGYTIKSFQLVLAYQQPLTQNNNEFLAEDYDEDSPLYEIQSTNQFKRSGDILFRLSYPFMFGSKFLFTPSLLPIYHLNNDKFTDSDGLEQEIEGSQGLTLNWNMYFDYAINQTHALQLNIGSPFIVREARPDGLTRSFVAALEYRLRF